MNKLESTRKKLHNLILQQIVIKFAIDNMVNSVNLPKIARSMYNKLDKEILALEKELNILRKKMRE